MFSRETLQRFNRLHTQVARSPVDKVGWGRWVMVDPFISNDQVVAYFNATGKEVEMENFRVPALALGLPSRPSSRVKTEEGWIEPYWCFRVRCFEIEQRVLDECRFGLDGDEAFIVDVVKEVTHSLDRVADILSSLSIDGENSPITSGAGLK